MCVTSSNAKKAGKSRRKQIGGIKQDAGCVKSVTEGRESFIIIGIRQFLTPPKNYEGGVRFFSFSGNHN